MNKYSITSYSYNQAKALGVKIKPSKTKNKKIDVYKNDKKVASIGDVRYKDYPTYMKEDKDLAKERRALYKKRHRKDIDIVGSPGYYANKILW
jgi:hypothetical protein